MELRYIYQTYQYAPSIASIEPTRSEKSLWRNEVPTEKGKNKKSPSGGTKFRQEKQKGKQKGTENSVPKRKI